MDCYTITEKYDWLEKNTNDKIWDYPEFEMFFEDLYISTAHFVRSLRHENFEVAKEMKQIFDKFLEKFGSSPVEYPESIQKPIFCLMNEWEKLQEFFDYEAQKNSPAATASENQNEHREAEEMIKQNSQNQLIIDDSSINYKTKNVYFAVQCNNMIPFEAENLLDVVKNDNTEKLYTESIKPKSLLVDYQENLPHFWQNLKPNSIVTNFRCLSNLAMLICSGCFRDEWKMELIRKDGIYCLKELPVKSLGDIIVDAMKNNFISSIKIEHKDSSNNSQQNIVINSDELEGEDCRHFQEFLKGDMPLSKIKNEIMEKIIEKINLKNFDTLKPSKRKFYRYCEYKAKDEFNYPVYFTTEIHFDVEEILKLSNSNDDLQKIQPNILKPFKTVSLENFGQKQIFQISLECYFADIESVRIPISEPMDIPFDDFKTFSHHSIISGVEEISYQLEKIIKEYEKVNQQNLKMEISKAPSCNLLKYTFCFNEKRKN